MARARRERATDRLNIGLSRISAVAAVLDATPNDESKRLGKQVEEAVEECYAALNDIRDVVMAL
jgi:hypothetical protein